MCKIKIIAFSLVLFIQYSFLGQELPPISAFYTKDYGAENQNWAISQDKNDYIYVANNKGLLEYNGASWQLYETPNETIVRSVKAHDNKIYTGFYMGFGVWERNEFGVLKYTSIVKNKNIEMLQDEQIWSIVEVSDWMIFKSLQRIYLYNLTSKDIKIITPENKINSLSKVEEVIYFHEDKKGLFKIENGVSKLVSNHSFIKENLVVNVFKNEGELIFLTQKNGFFYLDKNKTPKKWEIDSDNLLKNKKVYSVQQLKDKSFAIGTISNGLIVLDKEGKLNYQVNQDSGLSNNTVLSIYEDERSNIWLGLDNGINLINNASALKMYNKKNDFLGTVYTSAVYQGNIYLGTNRGLFYRKINSNDPFIFIKNTKGQVWSLTEIDKVLFCGHDLGTFIIEDNRVKSIFSAVGTWKLVQVDKNTILQGCYNGLYVLKKNGTIWSVDRKIKGFTNSSKYIVLTNKNNVFVNHEYKGVYKLTLDKEFTKVIDIEIEKSISKGIHSSIVKYQGEILYGNKKGIYLYDEALDSFKKDSIYSKLISEDSYISAEMVNSSYGDKLWVFSKDYIQYLSPGKLSSKPELNKIAISKNIPKAISGYENITHIKKEEYLVGTSDGYIVIDVKKIEKEPALKVHINAVNSFLTDEPKKQLSFNQEIVLHAKNNNLEFFFNAPNFNKILTTKYQYYLEGFNKNWSQASEMNTVLFENLPYGDYTFKVRAVVGDQVSDNEAVFSFNIKRPWYLSIPFIGLYVVMCLFSFYLVHVASKRYYKKQREELLEKARKESELKELESSKEIMKLNNDKLRGDIESKNRELASSTMNLIKKNDFLNKIKTELVKSKGTNISKVVKIIDENLNNTDDWKMFQEAFNNADKKFLKKIKKKHPNLTPNDLRLCAYLRLNLSSKEIAPLLNISPRSVEVKRYRLRKKMDLPHDLNLTNYILEI